MIGVDSPLQEHLTIGQGTLSVLGYLCSSLWLLSNALRYTVHAVKTVGTVLMSMFLQLARMLFLYNYVRYDTRVPSG